MGNEINDKEIILEWINSKGITLAKFYKNTGLSNGYLNSGRSLNLDSLRKIIDVYPQLAPILLNGFGPVNNNLSNERSVFGTPKDHLEEKERTIIYLEKMVFNLERFNKMLEHEVTAFKSGKFTTKENN